VPRPGRLLRAGSSRFRKPGSGSWSRISRARVAQDLQGLDAGQILEEPAAARIHEHGEALQLHQLPDLVPLLRSQRATRVAVEKAIASRLAGVQPHVHVSLTRLPGVAQQARGARFEPRRELVAQPVERLAQRLPPCLVPSLARHASASAVASPALEPVRATPRGLFGDLDLVDRRVGRQEARVVGQTRHAAPLHVVEGEGECHLAEAVVVAVGLAVGRDVGQARLPSSSSPSKATTREAGPS